ncbi:hypothetical protein CD191_22405 [Paenibacillus odorifer]|uniref:Uncharacterized protein n=1 Tax=Paenibacillus odorifer TaxID=189426 RepID=A0AAD0KME3_9BACL|nr:hypothetical protein CD191_22405 [Paenibacillus odorifer]
MGSFGNSTALIPKVDAFDCFHCKNRSKGKWCNQCNIQPIKGTYWDKHGYACKPTARINESFRRVKQVDETVEFVDFALNRWREKRDTAFSAHNLNRDEVYATGDFDSLPTECLVAMCYVDAYACVQAKIRSNTE